MTVPIINANAAVESLVRQGRADLAKRLMRHAARHWMQLIGPPPPPEVVFWPSDAAGNVERGIAIRFMENHADLEAAALRQNAANN